MSQSFVQAWIHTTFSTKNILPLIQPSVEPFLHKHITDHLHDDFKIPVAAINGTSNHLHILFRLPSDMSIAHVLKNIKGESSHWYNQQESCRQKFAWQTGYGAFSVRWNELDSVIEYIRTQKEHHRILTYEEECKILFGEWGMKTDESVPLISGHE